MPQYFCFCGVERDPELSSFHIPHSCGNVCKRKKNDNCEHQTCVYECHPGQCPPCEEVVSKPCYCGDASTNVTCQAKNLNPSYSCGKPCTQSLDCFNHLCGQPCHDGECPPCKEKEMVDCYCGNTTVEVNCGDSSGSCGAVCGKTLDCGNCVCEKDCHPGSCGSCPRLPKNQTTCPCG